MRILLVRPEKKNREKLDVLIDLHYAADEKPEIQEKDTFYAQDITNVITICSSDVTPEEKSSLRSNYSSPVIMLSGENPDKLISEYNVYRCIDDIKPELKLLIQEAFSAKKRVDVSLTKLPNKQDLEKILKKEIADTKAKESKTICTFEALYRILQRDPAKIRIKKFQDFQIGLVGSDLSVYLDVESMLKDNKKRRSKFEFDNIIKSNSIKEEDLEKYDLIVTTHILEGTAFRENHKVPIILLSKDIENKEALIQKYNIHDVIPPTDFKKIITTAWLALVQKFELDRLSLSFPAIAEAISAKKYIDDEQYFTKLGNHGQTKEEVDIYSIRGKARQISRFEAAYLIAMEEIERIKNGPKEKQIADLMTFYDNLYHETESKEYGRKGMRMLKQIKSRHLEEWFIGTIDTIEDKLKEEPGMAAKLIARYYLRNPEGILEHQHRLMTLTKFAIKLFNKQLQLKYSPPRGRRWLMIEGTLLKEYNMINAAIKQKIGKDYAYIPAFITGYFPADEKKDKVNEFDFLVFEKVLGETACYLANFFYPKELAKATSDSERAAIAEQQENLARRVIQENCKISAIAHIIAKEHPEWVDRIYSDDIAQRRAYYISKITDKFVGHETMKTEGREYEYPFKGGLIHTISPLQAETVRKTILDNIDPILDIIVQADAGVFSDRSLRNSIRKEDKIYEVDFEKLRNMPTVFDIASTLELGFASNETVQTADTDVQILDELAFKQGDLITKTQEYLVAYANGIKNELETVGMPPAEVEGIMKKIVPSFKQYEKQYYASAVLTDMIGFGTFVRLIFQRMSDDEKMGKTMAEKVILQEESLLGAQKCFMNLPSNLTQLKKFYDNDKQLEQIDNLINLFNDIYPAVQGGLKKCLPE